jgi:lipopolysaccharide export system permease protein
MSIISRYILKTHLAPFIFGSTTIVFLFLFQFLTNYLNKFLGKGLSYWVIMQLIGYNLSWMVVLAVPIGILFATIFAFGSLSASHEITIIKAGGVSLVKMMMPVLIAGIFATGFLYWFNDTILPNSNHKAKVLLNDVTRKKPTFSIEAGQFSTDIEGFTILSRSLDSLSGLLKGVTIYDNTRGQRMNIASADSGTIDFSEDYSKLIVNLKHGEIHQIIPNVANDFRKITFENYQIWINASGFAFERSNEGMISRGDRELSIGEMQKSVDEIQKNVDTLYKKTNNTISEHFDYLMGKQKNGATIKQNGQNSRVNWTQGLKEAQSRMLFLRASIFTDANQINDYQIRIKQFKVEIYKKYAIPFACFLFILVGCPLGIITKGGNFGISSGISLLFYLIYWIFLIGGEKLADRGILSPFLSMWLGNIVIGFVGILILLRVNNESYNIFKSELGEKLIPKRFRK